MAITPNQHGIHQCAATQQTQAEVLLAFLGKPAIQPDVLFPALDCCSGKALPGLPCKVSTNGVSLIPLLEGRNNGIQGSMPILCSPVLLTTDKWGMPVTSNAEYIHLQRGQGAQSTPGEPKLKLGMLPRWRSPPSLVESGWKSVPSLQFVEVEGDDLMTKDVLSHELAKKVAPSLYGITHFGDGEGACAINPFKQSEEVSLVDGNIGAVNRVGICSLGRLGMGANYP